MVCEAEAANRSHPMRNMFPGPRDSLWRALYHSRGEGIVRVEEGYGMSTSARVELRGQGTVALMKPARRPEILDESASRLLLTIAALVSAASSCLAAEAWRVTPTPQAEAPCYPPSQGRLPGPHEEHCRNFRMPRAMKMVKPEYPDMTKMLPLEGTIILNVLVCKDGRVLQAIVDSSSVTRLLDGPAMHAVMQWRFTSPKCGGQRVAAWIKLPLQFHLKVE